MPNPRLAGRYAKSLIDLATENNQLEAVKNDMAFLQAVCNASHEFVSVLKSPIIHADKKKAVVDSIAKGKVSELTMLFQNLLISKGRESALPEIADAFINQYNNIKGIHKVKLTTAFVASEELKNTVISKLKSEAGLKQVELELAINEELVGGFVLEYDNKLVDASILRDLKDITKQFKQNVYLYNIR